MNIMKLGPALVALISILIFAILPWMVNPYILFVGTLFFLYVMLSLGMNILLGYAGQFAFANVAFFAIGAYSTMLLQVRLGFSFYPALVAGAVITGAIGVVVGFPALRLKGLYLAIVTISFSLLLQWIIIHWQSFTFGAGGHPSPVPSFAAFPISAEQGVYYLCFVVCIILIIAARNLLRSKVGRAFVALRDSEVAAESLGINLTIYKTIAFGISAIYAGIAGGLYSAVLRFVTPEGFDFFQIVTHFAMVVMGGLGSIAGSILGAVLVIALTEFTRGLMSLQEIIFGGLIIIFVIFLPEGCYSLIRNRIPGWRETLSRGSSAPK